MRPSSFDFAWPKGVGGAQGMVCCKSSEVSGGGEGAKNSEGPFRS